MGCPALERRESIGEQRGKKERASKESDRVLEMGGRGEESVGGPPSL